MSTPSASPTPGSNSSDPTVAVEKLFLTHSGAIKGFIHALIRDRSLADDVLQETFLVVCAKREAFAPGTNFVAWACTIARFKVLETLRKRARSEQYLSPDVIECLAAEAPTEPRQEAAFKHLETCLEGLPEMSRRLIDLHYFQMRDAAEIANRLSLTLGSVYVGLSRARAMLRRCVAGKTMRTT